MSVPFNALPATLQAFVQNGTPFPDTRSFPENDILSAKQLRKAYFRNMQLVEPGSQYHHPDYERLMRGEIHSYVRRVLRPRALSDWDTIVHTCHRFAAIWNDVLIRHQTRVQSATGRKRERIVLDLKRQCIREVSLDPRSLGELESTLTGRIFYGMPSGHNRYE